jgi:hypothetical protein
VRKLFILIFLVLLGLLSSQCVPEALPQPTYPSDFEIEAFAGGVAPWTPLYMIQIYPNGSAVYSRVEPENRSTATWTHISSFNLTVDQMNAIWDAIMVNNFFSLEQNYSTPVSDGSFAVMSITGNGVTHKVITENTKVVAFDSVVITINDTSPGDLDLFYNAIHPQKVTTVAPALSAGSMKVTIEDCKITVTIRIELYGPGATADIAKKVEEDIEKYWNKGNPHIQCVSTCPIKEPGCTVTFDAVVKIRKETDPATENYHQVRVVNDVNISIPGGTHRSTRDEWDNSETIKVYAHEVGHIMGEEDQYITEPGPDGVLRTLDDITYPKLNHQNDIMANIYQCTEVPTQDAIDRIVSAGGVICPCECCPPPSPPPPPSLPPPPPTLGSPAMGSTVSTLTPRLEWNASAGATSYVVHVATDSTFMHLVGSGSTTNLYSDVPSGWLNWNTTYYWRVNATNAAGTSAWSDYWCFITAAGP